MVCCWNYQNKGNNNCDIDFKLDSLGQIVGYVSNYDKRCSVLK